MYGNGEPKSPSTIRVRGVASLLVPAGPVVVKLKAGPVQPESGVDWPKDTGIVGEGIVPYSGTENRPDSGGGTPDNGDENEPGSKEDPNSGTGGCENDGR